MTFACVTGEKGYCPQTDILTSSSLFSADVRISKYWIYTSVRQSPDGDTHNHRCHFRTIGLSWHISSYWPIISHDDHGAWISHAGYISICKTTRESFRTNI